MAYVQYTNLSVWWW